jgi:hypothetical protein
MLLLWLFNLGRITLIFWAGERFGEHFAIDVLHPFIGLLLFTFGVSVMILCINPMGLTIGVGQTANRMDGRSEPTALKTQPSDRRRSLAVPKVFLAVVVVLTLGLLVGFSNVGLQTYNLVADVTGTTKVLSYNQLPSAPVGWTSRYETTFSWAEPLFGEGSTWNRYVLDPGAGGNLHAEADVVADVIDTPDLEAFSAFGIVQCYQFHGYSLSNLAQVSLGGGITGQTLAYVSQQYGSWSIVYWILPIRSGTSTVYERVVLYVRNQSGGLIAPAVEGRQSGIKSLAGTLNPSDPQQLTILRNRDFLVAYARELIGVQVSRSDKLLARASTA